MQLLFRGFIFRIIFTSVNFIVSLLIAKLGGSAQFGSLSMMIVNAAILQIITGLGTDASIVWHGASGKTGDRNKIYSITVFTALLQLSLFVAAALLYLLFTNESLLTGSHNAELFAAELVYFTGLVFLEKFSALFYSQQDAALSNRVIAVSSLILLLIIIIVWQTTPGLIAQNPVWIFCIYTFIPAFILTFYYLKKFQPSFTGFQKKEIKSFTDFSFIVFITNLIQFIAYRADYWFINYFHQKSDVGIYAQAAKFAQLLWIVPGILAGLIVPALKNEKQKIDTTEFNALCRLVFYLHLALAILVMLISYLLYRMFLPGEYFNGFDSLLIMLPGYILFTITTMLAAWFSANRFLKINLAGSFICFLLIIVLDGILIPAMSYKGAAIANLVAYSATTFFFITVSLSYLNAGWKDFFLIRPSDFTLVSKAIFSKRATTET